MNFQHGSPKSGKSQLYIGVNNPRLLLAAAIFGVTPNLVIKGLQQKADEYATELKSSTALKMQAGGA